MDEHVIRTYVRRPEVFVSGEGCVVRDADGHEWLDFLGGIAVSALGHGHAGLVDALRDQAGRLLHVSNLYRHPYTEDVAGRIARLSGMEAVFFTNSGAEATECALKLARKAQRMRGHPERTGFVALEGGFHGRTMGALSVTSGAKYREPFAPLVPGVTFVNRGDLDGLAAALRAEPAALILEPIQGEGGIFDHGADYLRAARDLCAETGTLLIHDEVQCGSGRTGKFLCGAWSGIVPDIATLAKPIAAGLPMGACIVAEGLEGTLVPGDHGSTFAGGPLVLRAAQVVLEALEGGLLDEVTARGEQFRAGLEGLHARHGLVQEVRGRGLMLGLRTERGPDVQKALFDRGLITNCTAGDVVRFLPPYIVTAAEIDRALEILDQTLGAL
ncbi:MAG: acetylornithine/succinylornithine family transaminase [Planctomycetota bacterium]|nr:acetylornithine/succinylornithine family transaminase [Planctomycetota bacterium]MDA0933401.1 acetylornithine/succinylornithine family transaminase [Planctomycetota bacterium]